MPTESVEAHIHKSVKAFREAESFNNPVARTRAVWHVLMAIYHLMHEFNERDKRRGCR